MKARFQPKYNIKKGDQVVVISGAHKDRATPKTVLQVIPDAAKPKVIVEGVAIVTKNRKPNAQNTQGTQVKEEAAIALSNVMLWDATAGAPSRVSRVRKDGGKAVRVLKKSNTEVK
ncbi:MAG: ribosomal protein [Bacteroidota bacterium]